MDGFCILFAEMGDKTRQVWDKLLHGGDFPLVGDVVQHGADQRALILFAVYVQDGKLHLFPHVFRGHLVFPGDLF